MKKQYITTIWFDNKGKCQQVIKHTPKVEPSFIPSMVDSITSGNYYKFFTTTL